MSNFREHEEAGAWWDEIVRCPVCDHIQGNTGVGAACEKCGQWITGPDEEEEEE